MLKTEIVQTIQSAYADTVEKRRITGCTGMTDEEIKQGLKIPSADDDREWWKDFYRNFKRVDEDTVTFEIVSPFLD